MSYSIDLREKVIKHLGDGHSQREASKTFHVSLSAVNRWKQLHQKTGNLEDKKPCHKFKKLNPEKLKAYVIVHPNAYFKEIGEVFGCSDTAVMKALRRLGITRKKRRNATVNKSRSKYRSTYLPSKLKSASEMPTERTFRVKSIPFCGVYGWMNPTII